MRHTTRYSGFVALLGLLACGSGAELLFGSGSGEAGDGSGGSDDVGSVTVGVGPSGDTSAASSMATTRGSNGVGGTGGATPTSGTGGAGVGPATTTGSGGAPAATLDCGTQQCPLGGDSACCHDQLDDGGPSQECVSGPTNMDNCFTAENGGGGTETRIECQLPSHCDSNEVCCGWRGSNGQEVFYINVTCRTDCGVNWPDVILCDPVTPDCPVVQTGGGNVQMVCVGSSLLPDGYSVCAFPPDPP